MLFWGRTGGFIEICSFFMSRACSRLGSWETFTDLYARGRGDFGFYIDEIITQKSSPRAFGGGGKISEDSWRLGHLGRKFPCNGFACQVGMGQGCGGVLWLVTAEEGSGPWAPDLRWHLTDVPSSTVPWSCMGAHCV